MARSWIWAAGLLALPTQAAAANSDYCCGRKIAITFGNASPDVKLLVLVLFGVALAAPLAWLLARRRMAGDRLVPRTLAFLSAWRAAGPLLAVAWAAKIQTEFWTAIHVYDPLSNPLREAFGPGLAEVSLILWAGFLAGATAALTYSDLARAENDRQHLRH